MMKYKNHFFVLMPLLFIAFGFYLKAQNEGEDVLLKAVNISLQNAHYDPVELNDQFSERAFNLYLENLDGNKRLLLQEDVDQLSVYKTEIDNQVSDGTYEFFNASLEVIDKRIDETEKYFNEILQKPFNFEIEEEVSFADDLPYAETSEELKDRWRKYLKYSVLTRLYSYKKSQDDAVAKSDTAVEVKSLDSLEAKARRNVLKTHQDWYKRLKKLDRKERLSMYINSITAVYDPHTNYYPPVDKDNFDIQMSGRLEGIGAQLQEKDGYIKITNVIPGGPASLQGDLQANDLILKVAQEGEEPVDVIDWRINDAVQIITR
jgi:carboxyl-terminal processing protease